MITKKAICTVLTASVYYWTVLSKICIRFVIAFCWRITPLTVRDMFAEHSDRKKRSFAIAQEYVLVDSESTLLEISRRGEGKMWLCNYYEAGEAIA